MGLCYGDEAEAITAERTCKVIDKAVRFDYIDGPPTGMDVCTVIEGAWGSAQL